MKKYMEAHVVSNKQVSPVMFKMVIGAVEIAGNAKPGQFINIYMDRSDLILPRPISICDVDLLKGEITILYQVVGKGTEYMAGFESGREIYIAGPLGNGFTVGHAKNIALIGGGIGAPPLYLLAKTIKENRPDASISGYFGFRKKDIVILENEFHNLRVKTNIATDDGSYGFHGTALDMVKEDNTIVDVIYACGPSVMLKYVSGYAEVNHIGCQVSLEERMGCGIGGCVGCAVKIKENTSEGYAYKKVCVDGPVFSGSEVIWQ